MYLYMYSSSEYSVHVFTWRRNSGKDFATDGSCSLRTTAGVSEIWWVVVHVRVRAGVCAWAYVLCGTIITLIDGCHEQTGPAQAYQVHLLTLDAPT